MNARVAVALALVLAWRACVTAPASAQEFAAPSPAITEGAGDLVERGLPAPAPGFALDALHVRHPLDLTTRALLGSAAWRAARAAFGVARTGEAELGWSAAGAAFGLATARAGAAVRGVVRRDDGAAPGVARDGIEAGLGAWIGDAPLRIWASAPQVWTGGVAPPLARGLILGGDFDAGGVRLAIEREAPRRGYAEPANWTGRVGLEFAGAAAWTEFRERPWRGGVGVAAQVRALRVAAEVDGHPVLEPTVRLTIGTVFGRAGR